MRKHLYSDSYDFGWYKALDLQDMTQINAANGLLTKLTNQKKQPKAVTRCTNN
jgi:hypothetical protein